MTRWTAEVEWHEDLMGGGNHPLLTFQGPDWGYFHLDPATGSITATVTMEAADLLLALDAVLLLMTGVAGQQVTVNCITATDACDHESALSGK